LPATSNAEQQALREAEDAIAAVIAHREPVALNPQNPHFRRLQHQLAEAHGLASESTGRGPLRRVVIRP
jgi:predicted RNA-binding protein Jag